MISWIILSVAICDSFMLMMVQETIREITWQNQWKSIVSNPPSGFLLHKVTPTPLWKKHLSKRLPRNIPLVRTIVVPLEWQPIILQWQKLNNVVPLNRCVFSCFTFFFSGTDRQFFLFFSCSQNNFYAEPELLPRQQSRRSRGKLVLQLSKQKRLQLFTCFKKLIEIP